VTGGWTFLRLGLIGLAAYALACIGAAAALLLATGVIDRLDGVPPRGALVPPRILPGLALIVACFALPFAVLARLALWAEGIRGGAGFALLGGLVGGCWALMISAHEVMFVIALAMAGVAGGMVYWAAERWLARLWRGGVE
jgi:hypothetical protein